MQTKRRQLNDADFLTQFENKTLDPDQFSHLGHLKIAWHYISQYDVNTATNLVSSGIKSYAESLGEYGKFNSTITNALVRITAKRMDNLEDKSWVSFTKNNNDLVENALSVLLIYYSQDVLFSDDARSSVVAPDLKPL